MTGALHLTSQLKIEKDLGWETVQARAEMLGLTAYYKIHHNLTRPLTRTCMTDNDNRLVNLRNNGNKRVRHPYYGAKHSKSFFPYFTKLWNDLPENQRQVDLTEFKIRLKLKYKPPKCKFYSYGCKQGNKLLTRLRLERSFLNAHSFALGFSASPQCENCGSRQENSQHLFLDCPKYQSYQQILLDYVGTQISTFTKLSKKEKTKILLSGYNPENMDYIHINRNITLAVQSFLFKTKRFS